MPIVQSRLINLITVANAMLNSIDMIHKAAQSVDINATMSLVNSALAHVTDEPTRDTIKELGQSITFLYNTIMELDVPPYARDNIIEERTHFKKAERKNIQMANYIRVKRSIASNLAASIAQVPTFDWLAQGPTQSAEPPGGREPTAQAPTQAPYGQGQAEKPLTIEERIARRKAKGLSDEKLAKPRSDSVFPPGETDTLTPAQSAALTPKAKAQGHYDPDIISTSVPSIEDMTEDETPADRPVL